MIVLLDKGIVFGIIKNHKGEVYYETISLYFK